MNFGRLVQLVSMNLRRDLRGAFLSALGAFYAADDGQDSIREAEGGEHRGKGEERCCRHEQRSDAQRDGQCAAQREPSPIARWQAVEQPAQRRLSMWSRPFLARPPVSIRSLAKVWRHRPDRSHRISPI